MWFYSAAVVLATPLQSAHIHCGVTLQLVPVLAPIVPALVPLERPATTPKACISADYMLLYTFRQQFIEKYSAADILAVLKVVPR